MSESATQVVDLFKMRSESVEAAIESDEGLAAYPVMSASHAIIRVVLEVGERWEFVDAECTRDQNGTYLLYSATYVAMNGSDRQEARLSDKDALWSLAAQRVTAVHGCSHVL